LGPGSWLTCGLFPERPLVSLQHHYHDTPGPGTKALRLSWLVDAIQTG
jgi:hypothetical protein